MISVATVANHVLGIDVAVARCIRELEFQYGWAWWWRGDLEADRMGTHRDHHHRVRERRAAPTTIASARGRTARGDSRRIQCLRRGVCLRVASLTSGIAGLQRQRRGVLPARRGCIAGRVERRTHRSQRQRRGVTACEDGQPIASSREPRGEGVLRLPAPTELRRHARGLDEVVGHEHLREERERIRRRLPVALHPHPVL